MKLIKTKIEFTLLGVGYGSHSKFPAGIYAAEDATNQPDWDGYGKVFIENEAGNSLLLDSDDYEPYDAHGTEICHSTLV